MIELAPNHKIGLPILGPLMPASGFWGYGTSSGHGLIPPDLFGAIVTNPVTLRPRHTTSASPSMEVDGGVLLITPPDSPGVRRIIKQYGKEWKRSAVPVIAAMASSDSSSDVARVARALDSLGALAGLELDVTAIAIADELFALAQAVTYSADLPLLAKISLHASDAPGLIEAAIEAGAAGIVLQASPPGMTFNKTGDVVSGLYVGWGIVAPALPKMMQLRAQFSRLPMVVCGGVHANSDVNDYLMAGATAVKIDSLLFRNPHRVVEILRYFSQVEND